MRRLLVVSWLVFVLAASSCSPAARQKTAAAIGAATQGAAAGAANPTKFMIFGGPDHKTYLGCLNCSQFATDSVSNSYGPNGSPYSGTSIWNSYGQFGSPYSTYSACNPYATDPPVIVDQNGTFYGRLTVNRYHPQLGEGTKFYGWLVGTVCGG